jgi:hypothetical protein
MICAAFLFFVPLPSFGSEKLLFALPLVFLIFHNYILIERLTAFNGASTRFAKRLENLKKALEKPSGCPMNLPQGLWKMNLKPVLFFPGVTLRRRQSVLFFPV